MNRPFCIAGAACWLISTSVAGAGEITLDECLQRAAGHNSGIKAYEKAHEAAKSGKDGSLAAFFPSLALKARYTLADEPDRLVVSKDSLTSGLPAQDINLADTRHDTYQAGIFLTQPLFTGGNLSGAFDRASSQVQTAEHETSYQRALLYEQVRRTFYDLLAADSRVTSLTKTVQARTRLAGISKARLAEGYASRQDLLQAEAELSEAEAQLVAAQQQADLLQTTLRQLTQSPPDELLQPRGELSKLRIQPPLQEFLHQGPAARDDLKALQFRIKQKDAAVTVAKSGYFPNISLQGGYLRQRDTYATRPEIWSVTVQAEWQLFDWGKTRADVQRARSLSQQEQFQLEELQKSARTEIELLWRQSQTELSRLLSLEARLKAAEHAVETLLAKQQEGSIRLADLYAGEASLWQAYADYSQSAAQLHGVAAGLERATSQPMDRWLVRSPLYRPDFEGITARLGAAAIPKPVAAAVQPDVSPPAPVRPVTDAPRPSAPATTAAPATLPVRYRLQFGLFSQKTNAEQLVQQMQRNYPHLLTLVVDEGDRFRVLSEPYATRQAALQTIQRLGIREYLIKAENSMVTPSRQ